MHALTQHLQTLDANVKRRAVAWLWLGVVALLAAGVLSLLLVVARTPVLQNLLPGTDFFHVALVVHVDLSVLVWFIACAGLVWTLFGSTRHRAWHDGAVVLATIGTVMIGIAPFVGADQPLMNNYVPVLQHPWFYFGIGVLACALLVEAGTYLRDVTWLLPSNEIDMARSALAVAAVSAIAVVLCVVWAYWRMPPSPTGQFYFESLFWGGGHVLQFTNTVLVLLAWLLLAWASGCNVRLSPRGGTLLFVLIAVPLVAVPWLYAEGVASEAGRRGFTQLMRWGGLAALPLGLILFAALFSTRRGDTAMNPLRTTLLCSMSLFAAGGVIGFLIKGSNTMIPAHYHGSVVGVTLAFMGVVYFVLPQLGYAIERTRLLALQPYVYSAGQLLHISGLAISGGYGVQRKVAGAEQVLHGVEQTIGMGMMGLGGLLAAIGGLCFLIIAISALRNGRRTAAARPRVNPLRDGLTARA
jgi:hypothetical protein